MSAATTPGALERVHELRQDLRSALRRPAAVEQERDEALRARDDAQRALQRFYAESDKRDARREKELTAALEAAEAAVEAPRWADRLEGSRLAAREAREALRAYVAQHFEEIASELLPMAVAANERLAEARVQLAEAVSEWERVRTEWVPLLGPAGLTTSELPESGSGEPPMPRSLVGLVEQDPERATT
jgi:hypothetical protein